MESTRILRSSTIEAVDILEEKSSSPILKELLVDSGRKAGGKSLIRKEVEVLEEEVFSSPVLKELQNTFPLEKRRRESMTRKALSFITESEAVLNLKASTVNKKSTKKKQAIEKSTKSEDNTIAKLKEVKKKEYIREKKTRSKKADSAEETPNDEEVLKSKLSVKDKDVNLEKSVSNVEAFRMDQELTDTHKNVSKRKVKGDMKINDNNEVCQEKTELVQDIIKDVGDKNTQTLDKSNQCQESTISHARKFSATSIASHAQGLPEEEYVTFLRTVFQGMAKDRVLLSISTAVNILLEQKIGCNP